MFPHLPQELVRIIFEFAAERHGRKCALVSKQVQSWVEPIIYRRIKLDNYYDITQQLYRTLTDPNTTKPAEFFARHVKVVAISTSPIVGLEIEILRACTGVRVLTSWKEYLQSSELVRLFSTSHLRPTRLSLNVQNETDESPPPSPNEDNTRRLDLSLPIFQNLTHLELICSEHDMYEDWGALSSLSNLTHFAVDHMDFMTIKSARVARKILALCPLNGCLRIFVMWVPECSAGPFAGSESRALNEGTVDSRAVMGHCRGFRKGANVVHKTHEYVIYRNRIAVEDDWRGEPFDKKDFWEHAEDIVERRRQKMRSES